MNDAGEAFSFSFLNLASTLLVFCFFQKACRDSVNVEHTKSQISILSFDLCFGTDSEGKCMYIQSIRQKESKSKSECHSAWLNCCLSHARHSNGASFKLDCRIYFVIPQWEIKKGRGVLEGQTTTEKQPSKKKVPSDVRPKISIVAVVVVVEDTTSFALLSSFIMMAHQEARYLDVTVTMKAAQQHTGQQASVALGIHFHVSHSAQHLETPALPPPFAQLFTAECRQGGWEVAVLRQGHFYLCLHISESLNPQLNIEG